MRLFYLAAGALLALGLAGRPAAAAPAVTGDYIEARSCNIYVGACHAEGEFPTTGRQAVLAWRVRQGTFEGVSLDGVTAIAVVSADRNLGAPDVHKKAVVYVARTASPMQQQAMAKLLQERAGPSLGTVLAVKEAAIAFDPGKDLYQVSAPGIATLKVKKQPGQLCCLQKYEAFYKPFVALKDGKIGYSVLTGFEERMLDTSWSGSDQNNAYFGEFTL
jgi:hypothetical protein